MFCRFNNRRPHRFNTQPHEGGCCHYKCHVTQPVQFQHTAARRRLLIHSVVRCVLSSPVSTHSRTKAAALSLCTLQHTICGFNTQPHEGGCTWQTPKYVFNWLVSTHSRAEAAATGKVKRRNRTRCFNTQPRGGGCKKSGGHKMQPSCFNTQPRGGGCIRPIKLPKSL